MYPIRMLKMLLLAFALLAVGSGDAYAQRNRKEEKVNEYPNATRKEPKSASISSEAMQKKISTAYDALDGDQAKAKSLLTEVLENKRANKYDQALALRGLSQIALDEENIDQALDYSERALATEALDNKSHFDTLYLIAQININEQDYEKALSAIDRWMSLSGAQKPEAYALKGNALYRLERYPEAGEALKKAIALSKEPNSSWNEMLIATYEESGNTAGAAAIAEETLKKDPDNKQATLQLAQIYVDAEQTEKAAALLDSANQRGLIDDEKSLVYLANLYHEMEKPQQAATILKSAMDKGQVKPEEVNFTRLGNYYYDAENFDAALEAYTKGASLSKEGNLDYQRAYLLLQEKEDVAAGKAAVETALRKGGLKQQGQALILLGNAELELGNRAAAKAAYQKARAFPEAREMADSMLKNFN